MTRIFRNILVTAAAFFLMAAVVSCGNSSAPTGDASPIRGGETRATLSPDYFTGGTSKAYFVAGQIPEVLDSLHCYCECKKHLGHKSLLTCYVDGHASRCDICQNEAFMAYDLFKQGLDVRSIRKAVDERFSRI